jgi:DNA-directed RNA polymerase subunit RPC12/RpoP
MGEQETVCDGCGERVVVAGLDGDGRPFVRQQCSECDEALDQTEEQDRYYSLACEVR